MGEPDRRGELVLSTLKKLFLPNLLSALTTGVGFLTLLSDDVPVIRDYGVDTAGAVMTTWAFTQVSLYCFLTLFPLPVARSWTSRRARWSLRAMAVPVPTGLAILGVSAVLAFMGFKMNWSPRLFDDLPQGHPTRTATEMIDEKMGGVLPLEVVIREHGANSWNDPGRLSKLSRVLENIRRLPGVGSAVGIPDFVRAASFVPRHGPAPRWTRKSIAETYFLYSMSGVDPLRSFLTADGKSTHLSIRMHDLPAREMLLRVGEINAGAKRFFPEAQVTTTGMAANVHKLNENLSRDLIFGFWQAMLVIGILLMLVFRSLRWAIVACRSRSLKPRSNLALPLSFRSRWAFRSTTRFIFFRECAT
jgi:predicted RND superfamily exporter protein